MDEVVYPTLDEVLKEVLSHSRRHGGDIYLCRGARVGCTPTQGEPCPACYIIKEGNEEPYQVHVRRYTKGDC